MAALAATFNSADQAAPGHYGPPETAFLLLDFHSAFVQKAGGPKCVAALQVAAKMRTWAKSRNIQVIHCLINTNATPYPTCKGAERVAGMIEAGLKSGGGKEPAELLEDLGNDVTYIRTPGHVSALKSPGLLDFLQQKGIKSLVLAGLSTSGSVLKTAVTATDSEFVVTVISDGCADNDEVAHNVVLGKLLNRAYVTTGEEFQDGFHNAEMSR